MRQVVLDTETTGLSPKEGHRIIEIGCLELVNRQLTGKHLHLYVNPEREIDAGAVAVHGITSEFLQDKPVFKAIVGLVLDFIEGAELIIHNAPFDVGFLDYEFKKLKQGFKAIKDYCGVVDTLVMARKKHPGQQVSLDALCRRYRVDNSNREFHGALLDAELLAQVYLRMTGGQTAFSFDHGEGKAANPVMNEGAVDKPRHPLAVIVANDQELLAHQEMLADMKEKSGCCLWEEFSD